jgi:hypothetical protein
VGCSLSFGLGQPRLNPTERRYPDGSHKILQSECTGNYRQCQAQLELSISIESSRERTNEAQKRKGLLGEKTEHFSDGSMAKSRAEVLRQREHISHVKMTKQGSDYLVNYSVAGFYLEELDKVGLKL